MKYTAVTKTKIVSMMNIAITGSGNEANLCFIFISVNPSSISLPSLGCDISPPAKDFTGKIFPLSVMLSNVNVNNKGALDGSFMLFTA